MSVTGKHTLTYTDNAAHIRASIAPPSMTFVDQNPQVTIAKDSIFILTYTENNEVTIEGNLRRDVISEIEISAPIKRVIQNSESFSVNLNGDLRRCISLDVELSSVLQRTVVSYNVSLRYGLRRIISNTIKIEGNLKRNINSIVRIKGNLKREVLNDDIKIEVPSKKYKSFISIDKLYRVQHDVLDEDISDNPYFSKEISNLQNAALLTNNQTVIKAINELYINQRTIFQTAYNYFKKINDRIGDVTNDSNLKEEYLSLEVNNVIEGLLKLSNDIKSLSTFIGANESHAKDSMEILGYNGVLDGLVKLNDTIYQILHDYEDWTKERVEWIFSSAEYNTAKEPLVELVNAVYDEVHSFEQKVSNKYLEYRREIEDQLTEYTNLLDPYDDITVEEIKKMFLDSAITSEGQTQYSDDTILLLINNMDIRLRDYQLTNDERVHTLENEFNEYKDSSNVRISNLEENVTNNNTNLSQLRSDVDTINATLIALISQVNTISDKLNTIQTTVTNLELSNDYQNIINQITNIKGDINNTKSVCTDLDNRIKSLEEYRIIDSSEEDIQNLFG